MQGISIEIVAILALVIANGVFALSEIAIVSARKARLLHKAEGGMRQAQTALDVANNPNDFLSTVQVGITLVGTLAGVFGGATVGEQLAVRLNNIPGLSPHGETVAMAVVVLTITYLSLILGELVPKRIALSNPERFAIAVAPSMQLLSRAMSPAVRFLSWSTDMVMHLVPFRGSSEPAVTEEEVRLMVEQGAQAGTFEMAEQEMIEGVFHLGDRRAIELMQPRMNIAWLDVQAAPAEIRAAITAHKYSRFPVGDGSLDKVLGYVHVKDLLDLCANGHPLDANSTLRRLPAVPEMMRALKVLEVFKNSRTHIALVVNEHGGVEGLITMHDILEAVVGDLPAPGEGLESHFYPPRRRVMPGRWNHSSF
ncbi:MAG: hemolysin family protein [Paludibaculum sp.]